MLAQARLGYGLRSAHGILVASDVRARGSGVSLYSLAMSIGSMHAAREFMKSYTDVARMIVYRCVIKKFLCKSDGPVCGKLE
jgi:hypothetical protein